MSESKKRSAHTDATFFGDDRKPVLTDGGAQLDLVEQFLEDLVDAGARFPDREQAREVAERFADAAGDERAAAALAVILSRLPGGRRGSELRAALLGTVDISADARQRGVSRQSLWKSIVRLRTRLLGRRQNG